MENSQPPRRTSVLARGSVVRVAVFASILMVMGMTASLWSHWARVKEPATAIAVIGDPSLDGAKVIVEGVDEDSRRQSPVEVTLSSDHHFEQAIYRYPGTYMVTVKAPDPHQTAPLAKIEMTIDRFHGARVDLPTTVTIVGTPGDRITLYNEAGSSQTFEPNAGNKYRVVVYLGPGKYRMVRTHGGAVVPPDEELVIAPHVPREIALPNVQ